MIKSPYKSKKQHESPHKSSRNQKLSVFDFFKQATQTIKERSEHAVTKIHAKIIEDPTVYKLPLENRRKLRSQDKGSLQEDKSLSKNKLS
jgi:hypothetical protein